MAKRAARIAYNSAVMFDVAIVGAGLVGASLARSLAGSGLRAVLVDSAPPAEPSEGWDSRVYALSPASQSFLSDLGIWQSLDAERIAPVRAMRIYGDDRVSRLEFSAYEAGVDRLASIVESDHVQRALWRSLLGRDDVKLFCPAKPSRLRRESDCVELELQSGEIVRASLLVGADGMHSWVREAAGIPARVQSAGQVGVVANFACSRPHRATAYQWFLDDGVLAWLPLPGERLSMVWSTSESKAGSLLEATAQTLCEQVAAAGGDALGAFELITAPRAFPLARLFVPHRVRARLALIGDAAHVVHPLAGQGVNLGFGDARALAKVLSEQKDTGDPGDRLRLRRFERDRAEDILAMRIVTEGLQRLFAARSSAIAGLRNFGLNLTDRLPVIKNLLARRAMGTSWSG